MLNKDLKTIKFIRGKFNMSYKKTVHYQLFTFHWLCTKNKQTDRKL